MKVKAKIGDLVRRVLGESDGADNICVPHDTGDNFLDMLGRDWQEWRERTRRAKGLRVLIATSMANYNHASVVERSLAVALTLRGARVEMLLCDRALPACQMTKLHGCEPELLLAREDTPRCDKCEDDARRLFDALGLRVRRFSEYLSDADRERARSTAASVPSQKIASYSVREVAIGEHAKAGALRYYGRGDLEGEEHGEEILRRYFRSALLTNDVMTAVLARNDYDVVVFHHGIYTPQGIIGEVCRREGIRVVNWNPSYRKNTFIFSHEDTYHHTMLSEPTSIWKGISWTADIEAKTMEYLCSRRDGSSDWIWFHDKPENDAELLIKNLGIDPTKPCIGLLTSVMWDAQLHYRANAFPSMLAWILHTVEYFRRRPDLQLVIRVHPAEVRGMVPSRQRVLDELARKVNDMPGNIFVVPPEHPASTYALMDRCDSVLIYNTKTGIELSATGIPVIVAGEAWIRGKGFTRDARSPEDYDNILDTLPLGARLTPEELFDAKRYAYHFFFRRMIDLPFISSPKQYSFSVDVSNLNELGPGCWPGLDIICDGILHGRAFVQEH